MHSGSLDTHTAPDGTKVPPVSVQLAKLAHQVNVLTHNLSQANYVADQRHKRILDLEKEVASLTETLAASRASALADEAEPATPPAAPDVPPAPSVSAEASAPTAPAQDAPDAAAPSAEVTNDLGATPQDPHPGAV